MSKVYLSTVHKPNVHQHEQKPKLLVCAQTCHLPAGIADSVHGIVGSLHLSLLFLSLLLLSLLLLQAHIPVLY